VVYRIHLTVDDLARTRVVRPSPLMELAAAARTVQGRDGAVRFGAWRRAVAPRLGPRARLALDLVRPGRMAPTFLTAWGAGDPAAELDGVRFTPRGRIAADLAHLADWQPLPRWAHRLPEDAALFQELCDGLEELYGVLLAPHWGAVTDGAAADRSVRAAQSLTGGVEDLLGALHPTRIRWKAPVLELALQSGVPGDLRLDGAGVLLAPSLFGTGAPGLDMDSGPRPVIRYPAAETGGPLAVAPAPGRSPLAALLGATRAGVLYAVANRPGCSTKELAALAGIAPASASEHATVLREAGLLRTTRYRNAALHTPTELGLALLRRT
jgi:hypothetical protein